MNYLRFKYNSLKQQEFLSLRQINNSKFHVLKQSFLLTYPVVCYTAVTITAVQQTTWPTAMQIYWSKRKFLQAMRKVQLLFQLKTTQSPDSRDLQIQRPGRRLRVRDFLNTKQCARVNQRHFGEKTRQSSSFCYEFQREFRGGGKKL